MRISIVLILMGMTIACQTQPDIPNQAATVKTEQAATPVKVSANKPARSAEEMVADGFRRYGIEKGIIHFRIDGAVKGTNVIYFDNWGWREAKYENTTADIGKYKEETIKVQFLDGERRYDYDPRTQIANYFNSPQVQQAAEKYQTKDMVKVGDEMLKKMGAVPAGKGNIMDIECDVWELEQYKTTLHMWQGITMKEQSFAGNLPVRRAAILVQTEIEVPVEKLSLPKSASIKGL